MMRLAIIMICLAAPAASVMADGFARFTGRFAGCVVSDNTWLPISTTIKNGERGLSGSYVFIEPTGRWVTGTLEFLGVDDRNRFTFAWNDIHGTGSVDMRFSNDGGSFYAAWSQGFDIAEQWPWNGVRNGPAPDCRPAVG